MFPIVSHKTSDFISLGLLPVMQEVKVKLKAWGKLLGRMNLLKMKVLPKFTYLFHHNGTQNLFFCN